MTPSEAALATLTGVRSGKGSYYSAYKHSDQRLQRAVQAMESISKAVVRTVEGPRGLLDEVLRAAAEHLNADWALLALRDGELPGALPRNLVLDPDGDTLQVPGEHPLPAQIELGLQHAMGQSPRWDLPEAWIEVDLMLAGRCIGTLAARHRLEADPEPEDLAVLRILANQAAISLYTSEQYQAGLALHRQAMRLHEQAEERAEDLRQRTLELERAEESLVVAGQRELINTERSRIARELHDSVAQHVLSAGMSVELARLDVQGATATAADVLAHLDSAKALTREAVDQLRNAIYALHQSSHERVSTLPELITAMAAHYRSTLDVTVQVSGTVQSLGGADHEIARSVAEALFNVASHAQAKTAWVKVRYQKHRLTVSVSDDGVGQARELNRLLRLERGGTDGSHRGLANIEARVMGVGGKLTICRSPWGGVCVRAGIPLPIQTVSTSSALIHQLMDASASHSSEGAA